MYMKCRFSGVLYIFKLQRYKTRMINTRKLIIIFFVILAESFIWQMKTWLNSASTESAVFYTQTLEVNCKDFFVDSN